MKEVLPMTPLERDIERALVAMIRSRGGLCLKWVCPGWAGVPDRIILLPGGRLIFAELKGPGGGRRHLQLWWAEQLTRLGFRHYWICGREDISRMGKDILEERTP